MAHVTKTDQPYDYSTATGADVPVETVGSDPEYGGKEPSDKPLTKSQDNSNDRSSLGPRIYLAIIALSCTYVGSNLTGYFQGVSIIYETPDLKLDSDQRSWLLMINSLAFACTAPCAGYLQDIFGRRNALILGSLGNIIGAALSGAANGFPLALVGGLISGMGGAVGELTATAAIAELVPVKKRGIFLALNTAVNIVFIPVQLYAELLSAHKSWRWCYWVCLVWNAVTFVYLIATYFQLDIQRIAREQKVTTLKNIDYLGMVLLVAGLAIFIIGLSSGGQNHPWASAYVLVQLILGLAVIAVFLLWEWKGAKSPVVPFRLFKGQRVVGLAYIIACVAGIYFSFSQSLGATIITLVFEPTPVMVGVYAIGPTAGLIIGATSINVLMSTFNGRARELLFISSVITTAFVGASAVISPLHPATYVILSTFVSIGAGGLLLPPTTIVTLACPEDLIGTAVALTAALRTLVGTIGYAILDSIFTSTYPKKIPKAIGINAVKAGLPEAELDIFVKAYFSDPAKAAKIPDVTPSVLAAAKLGLQTGYVEAFRLVLYTLVAFGIVAAAASICLPNIAKYMTNKIVAPARGRSIRRAWIGQKPMGQ